MGSQQQTSSTGQQSNTLQFNPIAQGIYNNLIKGGGGVLSDMMNNPFGNAGYKLGLGESMKGATALGQQNINALGQNMRTSGIGGQAGNAFQQAMLGNIGRSNQSLRSQAQINNIMNAFNRQMGATGMAMSFSPQITGSSGTSSQNTTQSTSGLGTWLPQLLGAGLGAGMSFLPGMKGMSSMVGGLSSGAGPSYSSPTSILPNGFAGMNAGTSPFGMPMSGNTLQLSNPFSMAMMNQPQ